MTLRLGSLRLIRAVLAGLLGMSACGTEPRASSPHADAASAAPSTPGGASAGRAGTVGSGGAPSSAGRADPRTGSGVDAGVRGDAAGPPEAGSTQSGERDASSDVDASAEPDARAGDSGVPSTQGRTVCSARFHTDGDGSSGFGTAGPLQQRKVHVDRSDDIVITGTFTGTVHFGSMRLTSTGLASFVAKLDSSCQLRWARSFGGDPDSRLQFEVISSDSASNIYAGGTLEGVVDLGNLLGSLERDTPVLVKLAPGGDLLWSRAYPSATYNGSLSGLELDSRDRIVLSGIASADTSFGGGPVAFGRVGPVAFVAQLDGSATHLWSRSPATLLNLDLALGPDDSMAMSGFDLARGRSTRQLGKLDPAGRELWSRALDSPLVGGLGRWEGDLDVDVAGDILLVSAYEHSGDESTTSRREATLQKLSASGEPIWSIDVPVGNLDTTSWDGSLDSDASGNVLYSIGFSAQTSFAGQTFDPRGDDDLLLMKLTPDGQPIWTEQLGDAAHDSSYGLDSDSQGHVITALRKATIGAFQDELWVVKLVP